MGKQVKQWWSGPKLFFLEVLAQHLSPHWGEINAFCIKNALKMQKAQSTIRHVRDIQMGKTLWFVSLAPSESFDFFPPFQLNKLCRILARGRRKQLMDDREITLWRCWSLSSCHLPTIRISAPSRECTWPNTDLLNIPCLSLGHQNYNFVYWWRISNWHFPYSRCCLYVKDLLQRCKPITHPCHWNTRMMASRTWFCFSSFSHIILEMSSAWQNQLALWRKFRANMTGSCLSHSLCRKLGQRLPCFTKGVFLILLFYLFCSSVWL